MKKLILIITLVFCFFSVSSQSCLPEGITFTTQSQIDSFPINYPSCTEIEGDVIIEGSDITNLNGLSVLTAIGGYLLIAGNATLTSLSGLDNVTSIEGSLDIKDNAALTSLSGLDNVTSIGKYLDIKDNAALTSLSGLDNVTSIEESLDISGNTALTSLSGLDNVTSIGGYLLIVGNATLTSLSGLDNVTSIGGGLGIIGNATLTSLSSVDNVTSIGGALGILDNASLTSLSGLDNVTSIGVDLEIRDNTALTSLSGLDNVTSIGGHLYIYDNIFLSTCEIQSICDYLANPTGNVIISNNAPGCNSQEEVQDSCEAHTGVIDENYFRRDLTLYPNPANQEVNISTDNGREVDEVSIYNLTGQQVLKKRPISGSMDISHLQSGMYIVEVTIDNIRLRKKLLVQ